MRRVNSRGVYRNAWMSVREDEVIHDNGSPGLFGVVEKPDLELVMPRDDEGLWLVEQYRYPIDRRTWEFPQGSWGRGAGGSQVQLAAQELREETGLSAEHFRRIGHLYGAYGFSSQGFDVFFGHRAAHGRDLPSNRARRTCDTAWSLRTSSWR
jgi:8-oxo-dGTP pyrophosphatase MutT (NUDIX family)